MKTELLGGIPDNIPDEYSQFNSLASRVDYLIRRTLTNIDGVDQLYTLSLVAFSQCLDYLEQQPLMTSLIRRIREAHATDSSPREVIDDLKGGYWQSLMPGSAWTILSGIRESKEARGRFHYGASGGRRRDRPGGGNRIWESIYDLDSCLYNLPLLVTTFGTENRVAELRKKYNVSESMRQAFLELDLDEKSPEFRLALLCQMELNAKKLAVIPPLTAALATLRQYKEYPEKGIKVDYPDMEKYKSQRLKDILLGRVGHYPEGQEDFWAVRPDYHPADQGTEYWRGLFTTVNKKLTELAVQTYGAKDADAAIVAMRSLVFMQISKRRKTETAGELWKKVLLPIKEGRIQEVDDVVRNLIMDNPSLYNEITWLRLGLDREKLLARQAELIEEEKRVTGLVHKLTAKEKLERERVRREAAGKVAAERYKQRRAEELLKDVEPYIGQMGIRSEDGKTSFVRIEESSSVKPRGSDLPKEGGYVFVKYYKRNQAGELVDCGHAMMSYATALEKIDNGSWTF